jgi:hypothetical protein
VKGHRPIIGSHLPQSRLPHIPARPQRRRARAFRGQYRAPDTTISHGVLSEITTPHIASPDVHVEVEGRRIVMCFHGLGVSHQVSRVATSQNGIDFTVRLEVIGPFYMCILQHEGMAFALTMPGMLKRDGAIWVFRSQVDDAPERILQRVRLDGDLHSWCDEPPARTTDVSLLVLNIDVPREGCLRRWARSAGTSSSWTTLASGFSAITLRTSPT